MKPKTKLVKPSAKNFLCMVAPDRRLYVFKDKRLRWCFHVQAKNNRLVCVGESYHNINDLEEEVHRLWPHTQIVQPTPDQTSMNDSPAQAMR